MNTEGRKTPPYGAPPNLLESVSFMVALKERKRSTITVQHFAGADKIAPIGISARKAVTTQVPTILSNETQTRRRTLSSYEKLVLIYACILTVCRYALVSMGWHVLEYRYVLIEVYIDHMYLAKG